MPTLNAESIRDRHETEYLSKVVAGVALAGVMLVGMQERNRYQEIEQADQAVLVAAQEVATRYDCEVVVVNDLQMAPARSYAHGPRTSVQVTATVHDRGVAKPAVARYEHSDDVIWGQPRATGGLQSSDGAYKGLSFIGERRSELDFDDGAVVDDEGHISGVLYPRTDYADGIIGELYLEQDVLAHQKAGDDRSMIGKIGCGTTVIEDGVWALVPDTEQMPLPPPIVVEQKASY